ncbi:CDP-alcohol phosphatidyltransferase family protein [Nonomuraea polychroma]|uniref:CDP-alcohol phosphatidyltransferase family protein n=1 Tax=Nonomuraea polychroma TaxID=46176 RepID=UPI003D902589
MVIADRAGSRAATDALLAELRDSGWRSAAWGRFVARATRRSIRQAAPRPRAVAEVTLLHAAFLLLARGRGAGWTTVSWLLCLTHLGMLEERSSIGPANALTLLRAHLPHLGAGGRWLGLVAIATDLLDGRLARARGETTAFGDYADSFADAAFWIWFAVRHEPNPRVRAAALAAWAAPVAVVTAAAFARGKMVDRPWPALLRPAAVFQAVLAFRAGTHRDVPA